MLGFSAKECAETLETSTASINSALQRARKAVEERVGERSQQQTMRELGDEKVREIVDGYVDAWQRGDVDAVVAMLTEDAAFSMPPMTTWFGGPDGGHEELATFLSRVPAQRALEVEADRRCARTASRRSPTTAGTTRRSCYLPFALNVLTLDGDGRSAM